LHRRLFLVIAILASSHFYIWWRFVHAVELALPWRVLATAAIALLAPSLPVASLGLGRMPRAKARPRAIAAYTGFGFSVYLLLAAAVTHALCATTGLAPRTAAIAGVAAAALTVIYGLVHAARGPLVRRVRVPLAKLPEAGDGYTIVQLTDVHIGRVLGERFAADVVAKVNALEPDLIVITGDLIDGRLDELRRHVEPLRGLRAKHGVYAVTGNHEYYWNAGAWLDHLRSLGLQILRNEHVRIADSFHLAGVDDSSATEDVPRAVAGRDHALPLVLLAHHPRTVVRAVNAGVDLQLSGHTHGGQLLPLGWLARLFEPRVAGLSRFGATWLYVSEGTGFWGPPMRVGTSSEISHFTLVRPAAA
jgi:hypothetical protein